MTSNEFFWCLLVIIFIYLFNKYIIRLLNLLGAVCRFLDEWSTYRLVDNSVVEIKKNRLVEKSIPGYCNVYNIKLSVRGPGQEGGEGGPKIIVVYKPVEGRWINNSTPFC